MRRSRTPAVVMLCALSAHTVAAPPDLGVLASGATPAGFEQAVPGRSFAFPADHGPHSGFRHEWWYFTGNLAAANGERFGFELTFFRFALAPPAAGGEPAPRSAWRAREIYMAHFAVTDVARQRFVHATRYSRAALGLAGAQGDPPAVWIDDWRARERSGDAGSEWTLEATQRDYSLQLSLQSALPPVLNGDAGLSRKSSEPGSASYYYSMPRLAVHGLLRRAGVPLAVSGLAWCDREWGSGTLGRQQAGWDWFALQLDDGATLMFYSLRNRDGSRDPLSAGTWVGADGRARPLAAAGVDVQVLRHWVSPRGTRYPAGWRLKVKDQQFDVEVNPVLANQELTGTPSYWEGAVEVNGARQGRAVHGRGYVELVGYAPRP